MILIERPSEGTPQSSGSKNALQGISMENQVFHQVYGRRVLCLPAQTFETRHRGKSQRKTVLRSLDVTPKNLLLFLIMFAIIVATQLLYADSFLEITLKDEAMGIKGIQKSTPKWIRSFLKF